MCSTSTRKAALTHALMQIVLVKLGAPTWLSTIIIAWGCVAVAFAGISNVTHFYILRILLGMTESGTFPGMWYHMSCFYSGQEILSPFPAKERAFQWLNANDTDTYSFKLFFKA